MIVHTILGLPGETPEQMTETIDYVCRLPIFGIKLQLLHILKGTDLEQEYNAKKFEALSLDEYCDIICDCLKIIPKNIVIHRLTGDGAKKDLVAPLWSADKKNVLNTLNKRINEI